MTGPSRIGLSLTDLVRILSRHKKAMSLVFCTTVLVALLGVLSMSKKYMSEAKLLLRVGRETVSLDPTATLSEVIGITRTGQSEINTVLEVLTSRDLVEKVVDEIGTKEILNAGAANRSSIGSLVSISISSVKGFIRGLGRMAAPSGGETVDPGVAERNDAIESLLDSIRISTPRESTVVSIYLESPSPVMAQRIVDAWTRMFLIEHLRLTNTEGSHEFFVKQQDLVAGELRKAQDSLRATKDANQLASIEGQMQLLESLKSEVDIERLRNARGLNAAEARCKDLRETHENLTETVISERTEGISDEAHKGMRQQLYELEIRGGELLERYEPNHPLVKAVQGQVRQVRNILEKQQETLQHTTHIANPARADLYRSLLQEEATLAGMRADASSLSEQHEELIQEIKALNAIAVKIRGLERQVELMDASYRLYAEKSEQARVNEEMALQQITSVQVMQKASFIPEPNSPSRTSMMGFAILVALLGAGGVAMLLDSLDQGGGATQPVVKKLGVPAPAVIPESSQQLAPL